jgi:dihydroneopterin aldolase
VDYGAIVAEAVRAVGSGAHADLIETLAERVVAAATDVVERSGVRVDEIRVRVRKPQAPVNAPIDWAGTEIVRRPNRG